MNTVEQMAQALAEAIAVLGGNGFTHYAAKLDKVLESYMTAQQREKQDERCMLHGERIAYNGWTNYETWAMHLQLSNDEGMSGVSYEIVRNAASEYDAADELKDYWTSFVDEMLAAHKINGTNGLPFPELYRIDMVDWVEVARAFVEE